jgi:hypothetical protein
MTNRRQFIGSSLAVSALSSTLVGGVPAWAAGSGRLRLERFVFDRRFAAAQAIAAEAARHGVPLSPVAGDLTDLWYRDLDLKWKRAPMPLAGATTRSGLFVLETLAADHRMRVVYKGEHRAIATTGVEHRLTAHPALIEEVSSDVNEPFWALLGTALMRYPVNAQAPVTQALRRYGEAVPPRDEPLVSWIIAPLALGSPAITA